MSSDLNLDSIDFQSNLRSKPIRQNFTDVQNNFNALRSEFAAGVASTAAEVTNARDNLAALDDNIHLRSQNGSFINTGGIVTAQGTPDNTIRISTGSGMIDGIGASFSSATSATIGAPTTGRLDVVVINSDNTKSIELGNDSADKILPVLGSTQRPLAILTQDTAAPLTIANSDIQEIRRQGAIANGKYFFKIQDAINYISEGEILIGPGSYYEEIDLIGKSNIKLIGHGGSKIYRPSATEYAIKSVNTVGNETSGIILKDLMLFGNGKAGAIELLNIDYTDKFIMDGVVFDGNASSTATYKDFLINNSDDFRLLNNMIDDYGATTVITNATKYFEDGYYAGQVVTAGTTAVKADLVKMGFTELTAMANKFPRAETSAGSTGGTDTQDIEHDHGWIDTSGSGNNMETWDESGNKVPIGQSSGGSGADAILVGNKSSAHMLDDKLRYTDKQLSTTQENRPAFYSLIYLIHR